MNTAQEGNLVAKLLQAYAWLNIAAWVIFAIIIASIGNGIVAVVMCSVGLIVSLLIYALGEVIKLLNEIKNNTSSNREEITEEIPEI